MKATLQFWTVAGPDFIFFSEIPGRDYRVIMVVFPESEHSFTRSYIGPLKEVLETGEIGMQYDRSVRAKLSKKQMNWLKKIAPLAGQTIEVIV